MKPSEIETLLPEVMRMALAPPGPLNALLEVMAQQHAPVEALLQRLDAVLRPCATDDLFVPLLARWVGMDHLYAKPGGGAARDGEGQTLSTGTGHLRELVGRAAWLSHWRGTRTGLVAFLETACGCTGFDVQEQVPGPDGLPIPFHMLVLAPHPMQAHRLLIERIIESEKPAYATCQLVFLPAEEPTP